MLALTPVAEGQLRAFLPPWQPDWKRISATDHGVGRDNEEQAHHMIG